MGCVRRKPDFVGFCLFDRIDVKLRSFDPELMEYAWHCREIENYIVYSTDKY